MLPTNKCEDDSCTAPLSSRALNSATPSAIIFSSIPFLVTFVFVSIVVLHKLFPILSGQSSSSSKSDEHYLPFDAPPGLRQAHAQYGAKSLRRRIAALSFSTTVALAAVLAELILCEILDSLHPAARTLALNITIPTLLFLLVVLIPFLEIQSLVGGLGWDFSRSGKGRIPKLPWMLQAAGFAGWLICFYWLGKALPRSWVVQDTSNAYSKSLSDACLDRIGVIGITSMALLSGFASVSSPWHTFLARPRPVTNLDLERKRAGLDATNEMLSARRSQLRALQRKMGDAPQKGGFMTKVIGSIRGNADAQEIQAVTMEIDGLETMALGLSTSLTIMETRHTAAQRAASPIGKLMILPNCAFAVYCLYRILSASFFSLRHLLFSATSNIKSNTTDPITMILSLMTKYVSPHLPPQLNAAAWSHEIFFLLSGVMLAASFQSVVQTFQLFTRYVPGVLQQAQANAALIVAQIAATYTISSVLLLRGLLPSEVTGVINESLGGTGVLEDGWASRWFDGCFLFAVVGTSVGIWVGRRAGGGTTGGDVGGWDDWDDVRGDVEMQKRS